MSIEFDCPECGNPVRTPDATAGKKGRCPSCSVIMTIPEPANTSAQFSCACGASFAAKPELAGKRVRCPRCGEPLQVPGPDPSPDNASAAAGVAHQATIRITCQCGKSFAAKPELAGRRVACPNCQQPLMIPMASQPTDHAPPSTVPRDDLSGSLAAASTGDPLGGGADDLFADLPAPAKASDASPHDPLGIGQLPTYGPSAYASSTAQTAGYASYSAQGAGEQAKKATGKRSPRDHLTVLAGCVAAIYGGILTVVSVGILVRSVIVVIRLGSWVDILNFAIAFDLAGISFGAWLAKSGIDIIRNVSQRESLEAAAHASTVILGLGLIYVFLIILLSIGLFAWLPFGLGGLVGAMALGWAAVVVVAMLPPAFILYVHKVAGS